MSELEVLRRRLVDPNYRSIALSPTADSADPIALSLVGSAVVGGGMVAAHVPPLLLGIVPLFAAGAYFLARPSAAERARLRVPLLVRPWGVELQRAVPWPELRVISHKVVQRGDRNNRRSVSAMVFGADGKTFAAEAEYSVALEVLDALAPKYAEETTRPLALELEVPTGRTARPDPGVAFEALVRAARDFRDSERGRGLLTHTSDGYRTEQREPSAELVTLLARGLVEAPTGADVGPLAAILAAELGVVALIDPLLELTLAPSPLTAAIAKAAAQRLGTSAARTFPVREVEPFLDDATLRAIEAWSDERS